jgi:outer membrane lipoprotein SlyB
MRYRLWLMLLLLTGSSVGCAYDNYAQRGALLGGVTGTALGAAIGEANDAPLAGAAVGAIAGSLTGAAIGDGVDQDVAMQQTYLAAQQQRSAQAVSAAQLIQMSQSGLGDAVIITHIQNHGVQFTPTANDLISLKSQGVSDGVLNAVQAQASRPQPMPVAPARPVIVEEHYYNPWPRPHFRHAYPAPFCAPPGRSYIGFSFSSR